MYTTVLFGSSQVNVTISDAMTYPCPPQLNSAPAPTCVCPQLSPGNGLSIAGQGCNPVQVVALAPLQAFTSVVQSVGGVIAANIHNPAHLDLVWGITLSSVASGQLATVIWGGPVVNPILGTGGWNFAANSPVYVGEDGVITDVEPSTGWILPVGLTLSQNTILMFPNRQIPSSFSLNAPRVQIVPFSSNVNLDFDAAEVFDLTLTGNTIVSISGGVDGRVVSLRVAQDTLGGRSLGFDTDVVLGTQFVSLPSTALARARYQLQYDGGLNRYFVISSNTY